MALSSRDCVQFVPKIQGERSLNGWASLSQALISIFIVHFRLLFRFSVGLFCSPLTRRTLSLPAGPVRNESHLVGQRDQMGAVGVARRS